ncbi:MAG: hypothetical protein IJ461_07910, partial [Clostridia bacterium]|nr:hypothetical protein [Clostridia bacterium]
MRILIALEDAARALELALELENRHEDWSCRILTSGPAVLKAAWGYEALIVNTGREAISMLASHCPDVVILDLG